MDPYRDLQPGQKHVAQLARNPYSRGEVATTEKPGREAQGNPVTMSLPGNLTEVGETSNVVSAPEPHF